MDLINANSCAINYGFLVYDIPTVYDSDGVCGVLREIAETMKGRPEVRRQGP